MPKKQHKMMIITTQAALTTLLTGRGQLRRVTEHNVGRNMMKRILIAAAAVAFTASGALAQDVLGIWKTEANDEGSYLEVDIQPCGANLCGTIIAAKNKEGVADPAYANLGKGIIFDMAPDGENKWDDGEIWAPDDDKRYSSNMELQEGVLEVEGCVFIICRGQSWTRAN